MESSNNYFQIIPGTEVRIGKKYRHFKGMICVVDGFATHTETEETLVLYHDEDKPNKTYARPFEKFIEVVDETGTRRFTALEDNNA